MTLCCTLAASTGNLFRLLTGQPRHPSLSSPIRTLHSWGYQTEVAHQLDANDPSSFPLPVSDRSYLALNCCLNASEWFSIVDSSGRFFNRSIWPLLSVVSIIFLHNDVSNQWRCQEERRAKRILSMVFIQQHPDQVIKNILTLNRLPWINLRRRSSRNFFQVKCRMLLTYSTVLLLLISQKFKQSAIADHFCIVHNSKRPYVYISIRGTICVRSHSSSFSDFAIGLNITDSSISSIWCVTSSDPTKMSSAAHPLRRDAAWVSTSTGPSSRPNTSLSTTWLYCLRREETHVVSDGHRAARLFSASSWSTVKRGVELGRRNGTFKEKIYWKGELCLPLVLFYSRSRHLTTFKLLVSFFVWASPCCEGFVSFQSILDPVPSTNTSP